MSASVSFEQDARLVGELFALLSREQAGLIKMDIDAIEAILDEKAVLLQRVSVTAKARYDVLAANGFDASEAGMQAWLDKQTNQSIIKAWLSFQKELYQTKEMNRLNGMLINKHFSRNQQLLNHLQGSTGGTAVYGRDGQAKSQSASRPTLKA